jgi:hypothetical protein
MSENFTKKGAGSGIRKKLIPDPDPKSSGSRIRIRITGKYIDLHFGVTCQCLPGAFWASLALLEKGVESRTPLVALRNLILGPLEEVDKGRVGLEQVPGVLEQDAAHAHLLCPGQLSLPVHNQDQGLLKTVPVRFTGTAFQPILVFLILVGAGT